MIQNTRVKLTEIMDMRTCVSVCDKWMDMCDKWMHVCDNWMYE